MANIDVTEYLYEVKFEYLVRELQSRAKFDVTDFLEKDEIVINSKKPFIPDVQTPEKVIDILRSVLHLKPWHGKKEIIEEIEKL